MLQHNVLNLWPAITRDLQTLDNTCYMHWYARWIHHDCNLKFSLFNHIRDINKSISDHINRYMYLRFDIWTFQIYTLCIFFHKYWLVYEIPRICKCTRARVRISTYNNFVVWLQFLKDINRHESVSGRPGYGCVYRTVVHIVCVLLIHILIWKIAIYSSNMFQRLIVFKLLS